MDLAEQIANAFGRFLGPIAQNGVATIKNAIAHELPEEIAQRLSGKEITVVTTMVFKIPDLTKKP